jgi:hypothetical protein
MTSIALIFVLLQPASIDYSAFPGYHKLERTEMNPRSEPIPAVVSRDTDPVRIS